MGRPYSSIYIPCLPLSQLLLYGCRYSGTSVDGCPPLIFLLLLFSSNLPSFPSSSPSPSLILPRRTGGSGGEVTGRLAGRRHEHPRLRRQRVQQRHFNTPNRHTEIIHRPVLTKEKVRNPINNFFPVSTCPGPSWLSAV
jgi:hypothetical protein